MLGQLMKAGADLTKPRHALYYLYFMSRETAETASAEAETDPAIRCQVHDPRPQNPDQWSLVCERT